MSRLFGGLAALIVFALLAAPASAQGFTLNPFTKKEPEPDAARRSISDTPPASGNSGFQFPKLSMPSMPSLPAPKWPKMQMPNLGLPGMGGQSKKPAGPRKPTAFQQMNRNTQKFFKNTSDFVTAPFRSSPSQSGTPARPASSRTSRSNQSSGGLFSGFPSWLGGTSANEPPPAPRTVNGFLNQARPGEDE